MAKQIEVRCAADIAGIMVESLKWFVQTHYPHGADECSIAAREALLDLAGRFERELVPNGSSRYSSRIRAFLCQAVKGWLTVQEHESGQCFANRCQVVIEVCRGNSDGAGFAAAAQRDAACSGPGIEPYSGPA
jgi:hypothetical protein